MYNGHEIGDKVIVQVAKENREWGYNPCPDGTEATIVGFSTIHYGRVNNYGQPSGVYINRCWPTIKLANGKEISISICHVKPVNPNVITRRARKRIALGDEKSTAMDRVGDLPETRFWEYDPIVVTAPGHPRFSERLIIIGIDYDYIGQKRNDGSQMPIYRCSSSPSAGWYMSVGDDECGPYYGEAGQERGNVWKFYHDKPVTFEDLKSEAAFFHALGHTYEVRNPNLNLYSWTLEEALDALRSGVGHSINVGSTPLTCNTRISVYKFRNEELGNRIAAETLKGFSSPQ